MKRAEHKAQMGEKRNSLRILVGKPQRKIPLRRPRPKHRWVVNIKMEVRDTGWCGMDSTELVQNRDQCRSLVASHEGFSFMELVKYFQVTKS
jgi:hypothetical protein